MKKIVVIFGSSRNNGNTMEAVRAVLGRRKAKLINLGKSDISPFDYMHKNSDDSFLKIVDELINFNILVFATPVYWYAMSAQLKIFFDRLSDLITIRKDLGRKLKGKICYLIASGTDPKLPKGFEVPFARTCNYFDMYYKKSFYYYVKKNKPMSKKAKQTAKRFGKLIKK